MLGRVHPYEYQKQGVRAIEDFGGRALLADDAGLGKTLQALHWLRRNPATLPALVVCNASVKYQWEREALIQTNMRAAVLAGKRPRAISQFIPEQLMIINYDILPFWVGVLSKLNLGALIIDECQNIQNLETRRTRAVMDIAGQVNYVLALSATPLTNRPCELYPILRILRPEEWPSPVEFYHRYCSPQLRRYGWVYTGVNKKNVPELNKKLRASVMIRRTKEEVLKELPTKIRRVVPVELLNRDEYNEARTDFKNWMRKVGGIRAAKRVAKAEALAQLSYLRMLVGRGKVRGCGLWVDHFLENNPKEKLTLFMSHTKMVDAFARRYAGRCVHVNGMVTGRRRQAAIDQFMHDKKCRLFIANIKAAGTGIDGLQRVCSTAAFVELDWRPGDILQCEGRLERIGQEYRAWIYYLLTHNTIEERMCEILFEKHKTIKGILDGGEGAQDMDIIGLLMKSLMEEV